MTAVRTGRAVSLLPLVVDCVLLAGLLFTTFARVGGPGAPEPLTNAVSLPSVNASGIDLAVDPPSFWMPSGTNVTLEAVWSAGSPLCHVTPLWYRWSVGGGNATGFLNDPSDSITTFTADSLDSGTVRVMTHSGAVLDCGASEEVVERTSGSNLSIVTPLALSGIELSPDPLLPGEASTLRGTLLGGVPPYSLKVSWGDGARSVLTLATAGPFSAGHQFPAGEFVPSVSADDSDGEITNASVGETVSVGNGLEVGILPASYVAEVGVPVEFTGIVEGRSPGTVTLFDCSNATVGTPNGTTFACTFTSPGTAEVLFGVYPTQPGGPSASAVLYESVVDRPTVSTHPVEPVGEVGGLTHVRVNVTGGVMPISMSWNLSGNRSGGEETLWTDGEAVLSLPLTEAGEFTVGIRVTDAIRSGDANTTPTLRVDAPLRPNASGASTLLSYGAVVKVTGDALSGCAPFSWWVVPDLVPSNGSAGNGTLSTIGEFVWNGSYVHEGNLSLTVGVADGCGVTWQREIEVALVPPLSVDATVQPGPNLPNETLAVHLSISGGLPPFRLDVNLSDDESWNRTVPSDGAYRWLLPTSGNGSLTVVVSVSDHLGGSVETNLSVVLAHPPNSSTPPPLAPAPPAARFPGSSGGPAASPSVDLVWLLAPVLLWMGVAVAVGLLWRRRTRLKRRVVPGPDPVATLQRIIEPADGAERFTVELLAEEAGIPLAEVRSTIDRLIADGKVRSENGADGEEVLSWSPEPGH